jgi:hypothetical protein
MNNLNYQYRLMARNIFMKHGNISKWDAERLIAASSDETCRKLCSMNQEEACAAVLKAKRDIALANADAIRAEEAKQVVSELNQGDGHDRGESPGSVESEGGEPIVAVDTSAGGTTNPGLDADEGPDEGQVGELGDGPIGSDDGAP